MQAEKNQRVWTIGPGEKCLIPTMILVLNPNSSPSITEAISKVLTPRLPPDVKAVCVTAPKEAPASINDPRSSIASTSVCLDNFKVCNEDLVYPCHPADSWGHPLHMRTYDAVLVACFSAHPLPACLKHAYGKPTMHILEAAVSAAMSMSTSRFGILTTGRAMLPDIDAGVRAFIGGVSDRYAGSIATDLPVLHLQDPQHRTLVEKVMRDAAREMAKKGADAIILGCAGMAGMEDLVRSGVAQEYGEEAAKKVAVIDGTIVGVHLLAGLHRSLCQSL